MILKVKLNCPEHGFERFRVPIIKKSNIDVEHKEYRFRTRPQYGISGVIIGRNVSYKEARDYLVEYYKNLGLSEQVRISLSRA